MLKQTLFVFLFIAALSACSGDGVSQSVADTWPAKWCQAKPGNTKDELRAIMGQPTSSSDTQMSWSAHQYQFNAFFEADGTVRQLDINQHKLSDAEKAALACDDVRSRHSMEQTAGETPARATPSACSLVSAARMSTILGTAVGAQADGDNKCNYKPADSIMPYVEFSIDWGSGEAAMQAMGMAAQHEPGLANPYEGLGDQAASVGPALMVRTGGDLVTLVFSGVDDIPGAAKQILDTAQAGP